MASRPVSKARKRLGLRGKWDQLEPIFDKLGMNPEWALKHLKRIIDEGESDRDRLRGIDLWAKLSGYKPPERIVMDSLEGLHIDILGCEENEGE